MTPDHRASLPMYTAAGTATLRRFWDGLAGLLRERGLRTSPEAFQTPGEDLLAHWSQPTLLLSQSCGYPYVHRLRPEGVQVVGAFRYAAPGCTGVRYRSFLVCRQADPARRLRDFRGRTAVINSPESHSGCNALRAALVAEDETGPGFFGDVPVSGAHANSLQWVRDGRADIAAIDCVSLASFTRHRPGALEGLRILGETPDAPGLPLIAAAGIDAQRLDLLRDALHAAMAAPALAEARGRLLIAGFEALPAAAYDEIAAIEDGAKAAGLAFP